MKLVWITAVPIVWLLAGCNPKPLEPGMDGPAPSRMAGVYGPFREAQHDSSAFSPARVPRDLADLGWDRARLAVLQTELSPALLLHSTSSYLGLFRDMKSEGFEGPSHLAFSSREGPRSYGFGAVPDVVDMEECWVVVWFEGANGWTQWDSPWAVFLRHKPIAMKLDEAGLHLRFRQGAGEVVMMPLFGYQKLAPAGVDFRSMYGLGPVEKRKRKPMPPTAAWAKAVPQDLLMRVRYWASASRRFPIHCRDTFQVDPARDTLTMRQQFTWRAIEDDWNTRPLKVAPLSPVLALAMADPGFPAECTEPIMDLKLFTPYGPYRAVERVDAYEIRFALLQYIHETELFQAPDTNRYPEAASALARLKEASHKKFSGAGPYEPDYSGLDNFYGSILGDPWYLKAIPYYDEPVRTNAIAMLRDYFRDHAVATNRFSRREFPPGSGRHYQILEGPGIGSLEGMGEVGRLGASFLETVWAYAHFTGDWELVRERWDLLEASLIPPAETRWVGFGRDGIVELGDEAAPALAMARLAYRAGDRDAYERACYQFVRELTHHYVKQRGAAYFREHQPGHSMEAMDQEVYLTHLKGDTAGWQIDGPNYPRQTIQRRYDHRWIRFKNEDVARFHRDFLGVEARREMDRLTTRWPESRRFRNESHLMPSLVQLRSLLLNETPDRLASIAEPSRLDGSLSGVIGSCVAMLRTSIPIRRQRLIPAAPAGPFRLGLEETVAGPNPYLVSDVEFKAHPEQVSEAQWPRVVWWKDWRTPDGDRWHFGRIISQQEGIPSEPEEIPLNWNSRVLIYR